MPDIIDCNLKKDYQILIIFGKGIPPDNWSSNDHSRFCLTQYVLLHYLEKQNERNMCRNGQKRQ